MQVVQKSTYVYRLLIVDDDKLTLFLEQALLKEYYHIVIAQNGYEALAFLQTEKFDAVLTDINMPHMDGISLTKKIRALANDNKDALIIGVTASGEEDQLRQECMQVGMNALEKKPINKRLILNKLKLAV